MGNSGSRAPARKRPPRPVNRVSNPSSVNTVPTPPPKTLSDTPWRKLPDSGAALFGKLLEEIKALQPKRNPLILLVGPVGAGKSSFINSCLSLVEGRKVTLAKSGCASSSYTLEFKNYMLLDNFRLMDCMGIEPSHGHGFHPDDILYLLEGRVENNYRFDPIKSMTPDSPYYRKEPKFEHKTHCVVFVVDSRAVNGIAKEYVEKTQILQTVVKNADVPRVLLLTKVDKLCDEVSKNASNIFRSLIVEKTVRLASEVFSIDIASIHPVINYEEEIELSTSLKIPIALALRQILQNSCDRVEYVLKELKDSEDELKPQLKDSPWRGSKESENDLLEREVNGINDLCPEKKPIILLVGPVGAGKSSFINSCMTVGEKRKKGLAKTGSASSGYTTECKIYEDNAFLKHFRFMDIMGIQPSHGQGLFLGDFPLLLQGHVKKNYKFDPEKAITKNSKYYKKKPKIEHTVHCVVLVIDSRFMDNDNPNEYDKIKIILKKIKEADVPRVLILTHVDKLCKAVSEDASNMFRSPTVERAVKKASEVFSIEMPSIHPVINYEETSDLTPGMSVPIVLALHQIFLYTSDRVEQVMSD